MLRKIAQNQTIQCLEQRLINLNGHDVPLSIYVSQIRRSIGLKVDAHGVSLTLPTKERLCEVETVLQKKTGWIIKHFLQAQSRIQPNLKGVSGEPIGWLGEVLELNIARHCRARTLISRQTSKLVVTIDNKLQGDLRLKTISRALKRWRKKEALLLMEPKLKRYAGQLSVPYPAVSIREQKSRWGSCSSDGSIRMNARLIGFREDLIDYVCAHEACHLKVMNHSIKFYKYLDMLMPDHRVRSEELKTTASAGVEY